MRLRVVDPSIDPADPAIFAIAFDEAMRTLRDHGVEADWEDFEVEIPERNAG